MKNKAIAVAALLLLSLTACTDQKEVSPTEETQIVETVLETSAAVTKPPVVIPVSDDEKDQLEKETAVAVPDETRPTKEEEAPTEATVSDSEMKEEIPQTDAKSTEATLDLEGVVLGENETGIY